MRLLLMLLGRLLAAAPEIVPRVLCAVIGDLIWFGMRGRRRKMMGSLHHAFPEKDEDWRREVGHRTCRRTAELGLFAIASPYFSAEHARRNITVDPSLYTGESSVLEPGALVAFVPHFTLMEMLCLTGVALPELAKREIGTFYRPLKNPVLDAEVKTARQRFGMKLISRKDGFKDALGILRRRGVVAVLFDQNAGDPGSMSLLFGRVASTSELPGMLVEKYGARAVAFWMERTDFWQARVVSHRLNFSGDSASVTAAANRWLEAKLSESPQRCAEWLWLHNRWKTQNTAKRRLRLECKRDMTPSDFASLGITAYPATGDRFVIRMSNWLGDVVMALPLVRAIRAGRPDAHITLISKKAFVPLLESTGLAQRIVPLPDKGAGYWKHFWAMRRDYPDTHILFTNSTRGDLEARVMGAPQRFGMVRPGKSRPLLSHGWKLPETVDETRVHQTRVWEKWLREAHGLVAPLDLTPFRPASLVGDGLVTNRVGLVCGTENTPAKRWPVARWRELITKILAERPGVEVRLFGTANDLPIANEVAAGFDPARVLNMAGKTGLTEYCRELTSCTVLACNDTGGMHLANMLGVPLVAIFGPTNPVRTGPVFEANAVVLQPPGCPETGGADISGVEAERVAAAVLERL